jgi:hypothetical protein
LVLPFIALGVGMAFIWAPLAATATRNLPSRLAGAGSGVYNATRTVGAVLGSAGMASFMTSRITSEMPPMPGGEAFGPPGGKGTALQLPGFLREPFAAAMSQSMLLPAFIALFGIAAALFMIGFTGDDQRSRTGAGHDKAGDHGGSEERTRRIRVRPSASLVGEDDTFEGFQDGFDDDDDYVEYTLPPVRADLPEWSRDVRPARTRIDEGNTEPLPVHAEHPRPVPADTWHTGPIESWRSLLDEDEPVSEDEPIGFAHNGFHVDDEQRFRSIGEFSPPPKPSRPRNRHHRADPDESAGQGRHSY